MAIAASNFTNQKQSWIGPGTKRVTGKFTGPASYASGGEILTLAIAKAGLLGLNEVRFLTFTPAVKASDGTSVNIVFDHNSVAGTSHGKIRAVTSGIPAHTHSFLVIGAQAAAGTDAVSVKGSPVVVGKEAATDLTSLGGATNGGVQNSSIVETATEVAAATDLSSYVARFVAEGN